ncbi:MAG: PAS domain S-box protein [Nitrospirota bacterium]
MSPKKKPSAGNHPLRQKTATGLTTTREQVKKMTLEEVQHLVHDLQVHQIELEMQNEELRQTRLELEVARDRYATLFDFTPVGYVTLDGNGRILEANLTLCQLVGVSRQDILRKKFERYVDPDDQPAFYRYLDTLKQSPGTHPSDFLTLAHSHTPHRVRLEGCLETKENSGMPGLFRIAVKYVTIQEQIEIAQEEQKVLMAVVMAGAMDAIVTTDEEQRILLFNQAAEHMFRCSASSALGQSIDRFIPARFRAAHQRHFQQFGQNLEPFRHMGAARETFGLRADGEEFPIEASISQVQVKEKGRNLFTVVLRDITERRHAQETLEKEQQFVSNILETAGALLVILDPQWQILRMNRLSEEIFQYSIERVKGKPFWNLWASSEKEAQGVRQMVESYKVGTLPDSFDSAVVDKDRQLRWIQWNTTASYTKNGEVEYFIATGTDITGRRHTERLLQQNEEQLQAILDHSPVSIWLKDLEGRYLKVNRQFEKNAGLSEKEILGKTDTQIFPSERASRCDEIDQTILQTGQAYESDEVSDRSEGNFIEHVFKFLLTTPKGKPYALCGIATDITQRKQAEIILQEASQRLELQQQELRSLAAQLLTAQEEERRRISRDLHDDVNQRLALLSLKLESAQKGLSDGHPVKSMLQELYGSVADLSDDIRRIAYQYHPSVLDDLGLGPALRSLCEDFEKWEGMSVTLELPDEARKFSQALGTGLYRVAQESLRNVSKHAQASNVHLDLREYGQGITLSIRDNGRGFDVDERFSKGLGFVSMRERVRLLGGTLLVDSQPGQGTTVRVSIPASTDT